MNIRFAIAAAVSLALAAASLYADTPGTLLVRHAPSIDGTIVGSVQQMTAESVALNGGAGISGDLFVPGLPVVRLNGSPAFGGSIAGSGAATPSDYVVTLNGNVHLAHVVTRTDAVRLPSVAPAASSAGSRTVTLTSMGQSAGDFATIRSLTIDGSAGAIAVPPGAYGDFTANGANSFVLGVAGSSQPATYTFQHLAINGSSSLQIVGPVVIVLGNGAVFGGNAGAASHPSWLTLLVATGGVTLNGGVSFYGYIDAPAGSVIVNGNSTVVGGVIADALTVNGSGVVQAVNVAPVVRLTVPADGTVRTVPTASLSLVAEPADIDGYIAKVEFFADATKVGEATAAPYQVEWKNVPAGTYALTARATDNAGAAATSPAVKFIANMPPSVSLMSPPDLSVAAVGSPVTVAAIASDSDGTIAKVEFFQGETKIGETASAPYRISVSNLPTGNYTFKARATDNYGASTLSAPANILVEIPPSATLAAPASVPRGTAVTLSGVATDADGSVVKVEFYRDGILIGTQIAPAGTPPSYAFSDPAALAPGSYRYWLRSYDNWGLYTDSTPLLVTVLATLPYTANFEGGEGYHVGPLGGLLGWKSDPNTAAVTDQIAFNGTQSVALAAGTPPVQIAQPFAPYPGHDVVFVDLFARPVAELDIGSSTTFDIEGARFAFSRDGANGVLQAFAGNGTGGGDWRATTFTVPLGSDFQTQDWVRLTARLDFAHKTWDLYAAAKMVAADIPFRDATATYLSAFAVRGDAGTVSRLDYLFAGADNPLFADLNNNGIDDAWETTHGFALTANNRSDDPDGDGVSTVQEYVNGTDPTDYYNGTLPVIESLVATSGIPAVDGSVSVRVTNTSGVVLSNAPLTLVIGAPSQLAATAGGALVATIAVRTDAQGIARAYVAFNSATATTLTATAKSGDRSTSLAIQLKSPVVDLDHNGMSDDWEVKYFGHTGVDPNGDDDGDGVSNLQEYKNGTDPTDYFNGVQPQFTSLVGADGQLGPDGSLSIKVTDPTGKPFVNAPVTVRALVGGHLLAPTADGTPATVIQVRTDADGVAKAFVKPGSN